MKFDDILQHIGEFGPYQKKIYFLVMVPSVLAFGTLMTVFTLAIPDHRCKIPEINDTFHLNTTVYGRVLNASIPYNKDEGTYESCSMYKRAANASLEDYNVTYLETMECEEYVYDKTYFQKTCVTEMKLVCKSVVSRSNARMFSMLGKLFGVLFYGLLSDRFGRKKAMLFGFVSETVCSLAQAWSVNYTMYATFALIYGFAAAGKWQTIFVLGLEMVGPSKRVWAGTVIDLIFPLGELLLAAIAYAVRDWRYLQTILGVLIAPFVLYWWVVPESPRWLVNKGRHEEAMKILEKIANSNGTTVPDKITDDEVVSSGSLLEICKSKRLIFRALVIFYNWLVISAVWYGLSFNSGNLAGDPYLNYTLSALAEIPGYAICLLLLDRIGRRSLHCVSMLTGGLACIASIFPVLYGGDSLAWLVTTLTLLGKAGASAAFAIIYVYTAELFPTGLRSTCIGASSMFAQVGAMLAPYLADLGILVGGDIGAALPVMISGIITIVGGLLTLFLPETLNYDLPETIEEAKNIGRKPTDRNAQAVTAKYTCHNEGLSVNTVDEKY